MLLTVPIDWRRPDSGKSYELFWDDDNEYGLLHPRPTIDEVTLNYEVSDYYTHSGIDLRKQAGNFRGFSARVLGRLSWQLDKSVVLNDEWFARRFGGRACRILDVGCGGGNLLKELQDAGHDVVGLEPDPAARQVAIDRGLTVYDGSAENYPAELEKESFDVIIMIHVLEHTIDPILALQSANSVLKMGGVFVVETPNHDAFSFQAAGSTWRWLDVPRHLNFFTTRSLHAMCELAGLNPIDTEYRGYMRQFETAWIDDEQLIWDRYKRHLNGSNGKLPKRNTQWKAWKLFSQTAFANDNRKYDSLRVIAEKVR